MSALSSSFASMLASASISKGDWSRSTSCRPRSRWHANRRLLWTRIRQGAMMRRRTRRRRRGRRRTW
jgi:hypothetical protein